jgi:hypothetical protein
MSKFIQIFIFGVAFMMILAPGSSQAQGNSARSAAAISACE